MIRNEHLMVIAMEECNEVAQRISKALRFGLDEIQVGQPFTNRERIRWEYSHLAAVLEMIDPATNAAGGRIHPPSGQLMDEKKMKVEEWLKYSERCGTVAERPVPAPREDR